MRPLPFSLTPASFRPFDWSPTQKASHDGRVTAASSTPVSAATTERPASVAHISPKGAAILAGVLALAVIAAAVVLLPWNADVAPWASLHPEFLGQFTTDEVTAINAFVDAVWLPAALNWIAGPLAALALLLVPAWRRRLTSLGPTRHPVLADLVVGAVLLLIVRLAQLPTWAWTAQVRRDAGLLTSSWSAELLRWAGETAVYVVLGAIAAALALGILRKAPRRGWIAVVALAMLSVAALSAVVPFAQRLDGTRADPALESRVRALAGELGVDVRDVVVINTADRSPALNANVSGWGPTRTVTLFDTVSSNATSAEIDALVAHELIHARENDVAIGTALAALGAGTVVALAVALAFCSRVRRWLRASGPGDRRVLPLFIAVIVVGTLVGTVLASTASRQIEARADREAVMATGDPQAYADLMVRLAVTNKSTLVPARWRYALLFTHPTPLQRLAEAGG